MEFLKSLLIRVSDFFNNLFSTFIGTIIKLATFAGMISLVTSSPMAALALLFLSAVHEAACAFGHSPIAHVIKAIVFSTLAICVLLTANALSPLIFIAQVIWIIAIALNVSDGTRYIWTYGKEETSSETQPA